jgi:toxin CcdB
LRQFDAYENPSAATRGPVPFVLVLQSHFLDIIPTVIVAPMMRVEVRVPYGRTSVRVTLRNETLFASIAEIVAIERRRLVRPLGNLLAFEDDLRRALALVFVGV